jgi:hypothetical protein
LARAHIASLAVSGRRGIKSDVRAKVSVLLTVSTYAVAGANPIAVISPCEVSSDGEDKKELGTRLINIKYPTKNGKLRYFGYGPFCIILQ